MQTLDQNRVEAFAGQITTGLGWHEHHDGLFCGTERSFGANYRMHLVSEWLPALTGVVEKLERGASVADVGCT